MPSIIELEYMKNCYKMGGINNIVNRNLDQFVKKSMWFDLLKCVV